MNINFRSIAAGIMVLLAVSGTMADEKLDTFKSIYSGEMDKIVAQHASDMGDVQSAYIAYLDAEIKKATDKADLDSYKKLEAEKSRIQEENTFPPNSSVQPLMDKAELKKNAAIVDLSKKYVAGLRNHMSALMKEKDIAGASAVQEEIKKVEAVGASLSASIPSQPTQVASTVAASSYSGSVILPLALKKDLVLWYGFDKDEKDKVTDKSGKRNDGKVDGATWKALGDGRKGVMEFDGKDDAIDLNTMLLEIDDNGHSVTLSAWICLSTGRAKGVLVSQYKSDPKDNSRFSWGLEDQNLFYFRGGPSIVARDSIDSGNWLHVLTTKDANGRITHYINGKQSGGGFQKGNYSRINTRIGAYPRNVHEMNYMGLLDDIMIFSRDLSEAEVKQLYEATGGK